MSPPRSRPSWCGRRSIGASSRQIAITRVLLDNFPICSPSSSLPSATCIAPTMNELWRDREGAQHVQAHRGADEPRGGQRDGGTDVLESEPLRNRQAQRAVVYPEHHRDVGAAVDLGHHPRPQHLGQHDPGFDVDHVVTGQHRHRAGTVDACRLQRLNQRRVAEDHRHVECARRRQEPVVLVDFDDRDVVSRSGRDR